MRIPIYQIDAFSSRPFAGNPAAVCPLERWLDEPTLQAIAAENNLSETAFFVPGERPLRIRWFSPVSEVDLCGHATLASARVYLDRIEPGSPSVTFESKSGPLTVRREGELLAMELPAWPAEPCEVPPALERGLGRRPVETLRSRDLLAVFEAEAAVRALAPEPGPLATLEAMGVIATAPGTESDFVLRFFAPRVGIPEDPATGSAHCTLVPYWAARLGRPRLTARQLSARGGEFQCELRDGRVVVAGRTVPYLEGAIFL